MGVRVELLDRQRRAVFVTSLLLLAAIVFDIEGNRLSAGGLTLDFHSQAWLYAILTIAWLWEVYRYWLVERADRVEARRNFRESVIKEVPREALVAAYRERAKAEILRQHSLDEASLVEVDVKDWHRDADGWLIIWQWKQAIEGSKPPRFRIETQATQVRPRDVPDLFRRSTIREHLRNLYATERLAPWVAAALPVVAFLFYRLPLLLTDWLRNAGNGSAP